MTITCTADVPAYAPRLSGIGAVLRSVAAKGRSGIHALVLAVLTLAAPLSAAAADFDQGVEVSGNSAKIWFRSNVSSTWVDVHYQVNGGQQQNFRMGSANGRYEQSLGVSAGNVLSYFFTYTKSGLAYDTQRFSYTVPSSPPPQAGPVCFYESINYGGRSFCADGERSWIGAEWNDVVSSVKVQPGYRVELLENVNFAGRSLVLTADTAYVGNFNDLASSFRISRSGGGVDLPVGNGVMTFKLDNATAGAWADRDIYWAILAYNPATNALSYVDAQGKVIPAKVADNNAPNRLVKNGSSYANYFNRMSDAPWVSLPKVYSGRMFLSVGSPMYIKIVDGGNGNIGFAGPDINNPSDPNQDVVFDFIEFTINDLGYFGNTTRVDQFGFPLRTRLIGKDGYDRTLGENRSRAQIFSDFENINPAEFRALVKRPYRIVAPAKSVFGPGQPYANYYDGYVNQVWDWYRNRDLVFTTEAGTFRGRVTGNDFIFTKDGGPGGLYIRGKPTTQNILEASGNLASGNSLELVVQAQISAALNRHLLVTVDPSRWNDAQTYYATAPANYYAKFWHDRSIDGLAYGFSYDDVRNKSTLLEHPDPQGLIISVGW